ncbi:ISAs1 family transposase [Xenorhabdus sp. Flor]|nr:ISAs1 family transposase [Xenorhabdus sp. Flor]
MAVKGNQETLYRAVKQALSTQVSAVSNVENVTREQGYGRTEAREYHVLPTGELIVQFPEWKNLKSIGVTVGYGRDNKEKESLDCRYYMSSAELSTADFAVAVRGHWGIENRVYWVLDVPMREDACQIH